MKRLYVYRARDRWFGQSIETESTEGGLVETITNISIPQSKGEIEAYARENGYRLEWDVPPASEHTTAGT
jgi:hypothetical protein